MLGTTILGNPHMSDMFHMFHMLWRFNLHDSKIKVELEREQAKNPELKQLLKVFGGRFFGFLFAWKNGFVGRQKI